MLFQVKSGTENIPTVPDIHFTVITIPNFPSKNNPFSPSSPPALYLELKDILA